MIISDEDFVNQMMQILEDDILLLKNNYQIISNNKIFSSIENLAFQRLTDVKENFPYFILFLIEPFFDYMNSQQKQILKNSFLEICKIGTRIHLYARILDDALDENLAIHRFNLLNYQSIYFNNLLNIGKIFTTKNFSAEIQIETSKLLDETIIAIQKDNIHFSPECLGKKNHHLLLIPLLLSALFDNVENNDNFQKKYIKSRGNLSLFIAMSQASDEFAQYQIEPQEDKNNFANFINSEFNSNKNNNEFENNQQALTEFYNFGWKLATKRIVNNAKRFINFLTNIKY